MKTKRLAMRSSRPKATRLAFIELIKSIWVVFSKLAVLLFTVSYLTVNMLIKIAGVLLKLIKQLLGYLWLGMKKVWAIREAKGFITGFTLASIIAITLYTQLGAVEVQQITSVPNTEIENVDAIVDSEVVEVKPTMAVIEELEPVELEIAVDWNGIDFVSLSYNEKVEMLEKRLQYIGVAESDIPTYIRIATAESCKGKGDYPVDVCMNPTRVPPVVVKHCKSNVSGNWYVVEVNSNGGQAQCRAGDTEGMNEQSMGIFQILETTWSGHQCTGDRTNWLDQIDCAKKIKETSGFNSWSTY